MRRGDIVTVAAQGDFGKPRPAVVIQANAFAEHSTVIVCPFSSTFNDVPLMRITVEPTADNGLKALSQIMVDKIVTLRRGKIGRRIGGLDAETMFRLNRSLVTWLGLGA